MTSQKLVGYVAIEVLSSFGSGSHIKPCQVLEALGSSIQHPRRPFSDSPGLECPTIALNLTKCSQAQIMKCVPASQRTKTQLKGHPHNEVFLNPSIICRISLQTSKFGDPSGSTKTLGNEVVKMPPACSTKKMDRINYLKRERLDPRVSVKFHDTNT